MARAPPPRSLQERAIRAISKARGRGWGCTVIVAAVLIGKTKKEELLEPGAEEE